MEQEVDKKIRDDAWNNEQIEARNFRSKFRPIYSYVFLGLICGQATIAVILLVLLMGYGYIKLEQWTFGIFTMGVFAGIPRSLYTIVKYLFSSDILTKTPRN